MKIILRMVMNYLIVAIAAYLTACFMSMEIITPTDILMTIIMLDSGSRGGMVVFFLFSLVGMFGIASLMEETPEERAALNAAVNRDMAMEARADAIRDARRTSPAAIDIALGVAGGVVLGGIVSDIID